LPLAHFHELAEVDSVLADAAAGRGRLLLIEGAPGLGKTALLEEAARRAAARGFRIGRARARSQQRDLPGSFLGAAIEQLDRRPPGDDLERELFERIASPRPLALLLDDAHAADDLSLAVLGSLAQRISSRPVLLGIAFKPHLLDGHRSLIDDLSIVDHAARLRLARLSGGACEQMIRASLPDASPAFCEQCTQLTGGIPFLLAELLTWVSVNGLDPVDGTPARALKPVPNRALREFVGRVLDELPADAAAVCSAVALSENPLALADAARLARLDPGRLVGALDTLLEAGLVAAGEPLTLVAPLVADCIRADRPAAIDAQEPTADRLLELADQELEEGRPEEARPLIHRALQDPGEGAGRRPDALARLGHVELALGRPAAAAPLAAEAAALGRGQSRATALLELGIAQLAVGSPLDASLAFDSASEVMPAEDPRRRVAEVRGALAGLLAPESLAAAAARIEAAATECAGSPWAGELLLAIAWRRLAEGSPHTHVVEGVRDALDARDGEHRPLSGYFEATAGALLVLCDDFIAAEGVCEQALTAAQAAGVVLAERNIQTARALASLHQGQLEETAERCARIDVRGEDDSRFISAIAAAIKATTLIERDGLSDAEMLIGTALAAPATPELPRLLLLEVQARLCLERDERPRALAAVHEAEQLAGSLRIENPAVVAWAPIAALAYARSGDEVRARELAREAGEMADSFGAPRTRALALRTHALVDGLASGLERLEAALRALEGSPAALERAKVLVLYGAALHRAGRDRAARAHLREGVDLADRLGATRVARRGIAALLAAGGRPRRFRTRGPDALTPAERRVAELARDGATNREIAETLVVTRKTVEWHLRKVFVKLEVSSRGELRGPLGHDARQAAPANGSDRGVDPDSVS
jgi:DNA-binding CsgD family transcriptional regulator